MRCLCLAILLACLPIYGMTITDLAIGKHVSGPNLTAKDLKGKVVYVVYWGTH